MKPKHQKNLKKQLDKEGFVSTIFMDKNGDPFFVSAWKKDIIVTKLFEEKTQDEHLQKES